MTESFAPPPPAIRVRHLWHRYGNLDVLRDVSFDVNHGEIFGFIGPNGAGKTTTIRAMATLLEPTAGRIEVDGIDVGVDPDRVRRIIGYMADHAGIYERITAREFLEWRREGGGPERELVAAIVGAMVIGEKKAQAAPVALQQVVSANGDGGAWRNYGRMRQMR